MGGPGEGLPSLTEVAERLTEVAMAAGKFVVEKVIDFVDNARQGSEVALGALAVAKQEIPAEDPAAVRKRDRIQSETITPRGERDGSGGGRTTSTKLPLNRK